MTDRYKVIVPEFADAKANGVIRKQGDLMPVSTPKSRINDLLGDHNDGRDERLQGSPIIALVEEEVAETAEPDNTDETE
ncbi:hypothetical protein LK472_06340 [Leuconostoc lactis]|uniref:Uncharacterized protein n=1 Tax=Leuconostoc lactis TaxID=1246 RepID=A0A6L7ADJ4_LEULA|nr:hypothetical protein [Leuconostoc lactis]MCC2745025.1 hypothetical protein [Leuconostoc lactis]MCC2755563.1 hypothetical protein [Leuconostoc lactis]MWN21309.1 hypothetical protein [Leuconostoc lactis]